MLEKANQRLVCNAQSINMVDNLAGEVDECMFTYYCHYIFLTYTIGAIILNTMVSAIQAVLRKVLDKIDGQ